MVGESNRQNVTLFTRKCLEGIRPNPEEMRENLLKLLMLVMALIPYTSYDKSAFIAKNAHEKIACKGVGGVTLDT